MAAALATMWLGLKFEYLGGSSVGCLSLGILVSFAWERGFPPYLCKGEGAGSCELPGSLKGGRLGLALLPTP